MALLTVAPAAYQTIQNDNGAAISGGKVAFFLAGTATPAVTWADANGLAMNTNPLVADAAGRWVAFWTPGQALDLEFMTAAGTVFLTVPNVLPTPSTSQGEDTPGTAGENLVPTSPAYISDGSGGKTAGRWYQTDSANAYSSTLPVVGFPLTAISAGGSGTFRLGGQVTGLSGLTVGTNYYVGTPAGTMTATAPANARLLGRADSITSLILVGSAPPQVSTAPSTITTTGTQTALAIPTSTGNVTVICNNATLLTIQGITAGFDGQQLTLISVGAGQVDLVHQSGSATAANRLINCATSANTSLAAGSGKAVYVYDATAGNPRWRLVNHVQGAWITPTFAAGNFTGNGAMTWTVAAGDATRYAYMLSGRTLSMSILLNTTTVGGTPNSELRAAIPGGFSAASFDIAPAGAIDNNAAVSVARWQTTASPLIGFSTGTGNWSAATDTTYIFCAMTFEVT